VEVKEKESIKAKGAINKKKKNLLLVPEKRNQSGPTKVAMFGTKGSLTK